jgi:hypothetical protein
VALPDRDSGALVIFVDVSSRHPPLASAASGRRPAGPQAISGALKGTRNRNGKVKTPGLCALFGLPPFTPHDLRRMAAKMCGNLGSSESAISQCLDMRLLPTAMTANRCRRSPTSLQSLCGQTCGPKARSGTCSNDCTKCQSEHLFLNGRAELHAAWTRLRPIKLASAAKPDRDR